MRLPTIRGIIDRRILVNYRVAPEVLARQLPAPFRPQLVDGHGIAGICLIRLKQLRPRFLPAFVGVSSENAAHRIAVEWDDAGAIRTGVYIPRRDTSSRFNVFAGGRIFPGTHHHARFDVDESGDSYSVAVNSFDGAARLKVEGDIAADLPNDSVFSSLAAATRFFKEGSLGYSPCASGNRYDGLECRITHWKMQPLDVHHVESSFFDDREAFPSGSVKFDSALLMRDIPHEWHEQDPPCCDG